MNCNCTPEERAIGHAPHCPLNEALKPASMAPRKPFEEMTRDEMIVAHAALRHQTAEYVSELHAITKAAAKAVEKFNVDGDMKLSSDFFSAMGELDVLLGEKPLLS